MYFSQKVLLSGLQISSIIIVQARTTTYTSCFVEHWTFSKSCSTSLSPPARPPSLCLCISLSLSFVVVRGAIEHPIKPYPEPLLLLSSGGPQTPQSFQTRAELWGWGRVEGILSCLLRSIFTIFCALCSLYPDLSERHHSRRLAPPDPLLCLSLSVCSNGGPDNNSTRCRIVHYWKPPRMHKQLTHLVVFFGCCCCCFSGHTPDRHSGRHFIGPSCVCLGRGFVEPRPPAGIREDNSGAFRWVFHWLLSPRNSHNIIGAVHFLPASPLCPIVTQSVCLSTSSFFLYDLKPAFPLWLLSIHTLYF